MKRSAQLLLSGPKPGPKTTTIYRQHSAQIRHSGPSPIPDSRPSRQPHKVLIWDNPDGLGRFPKRHLSC
jgi:hypothetical protein